MYSRPALREEKKKKKKPTDNINAVFLFSSHLESFDVVFEEVGITRLEFRPRMGSSVMSSRLKNTYIITEKPKQGQNSNGAFYIMNDSFRYKFSNYKIFMRHSGRSVITH